MEFRYLALQRCQSTAKVWDDPTAEVSDIGTNSCGGRFNRGAYALHLRVKQQILVDGHRDAVANLLNDEIERIHALLMVCHLSAPCVFVVCRFLEVLLGQRQLVVEGGVAGCQPPHSNGTQILFLQNSSNIPVGLIKDVHPRPEFPPDFSKFPAVANHCNVTGMF